mgnify:CR=1 FL=1
MTISRKIFGDLAEAILEVGAIQAVKYYNPKLRVKATRRLSGGKIDRRDKGVEILFTVGPPNYAERKFIRQAVKAGEPFPIKKLQLKWLK